MFINSLKKPLDYIIFSKKKILNKKLYCTSHSINVPRLELLNGSSIPQIGLGTWKSEPSLVTNVVEHAIKIGYRHLDCAPIYNNEREVGIGIKNALSSLNLKREDLFITSKLWNTDHFPDRVRTACEQSLHNLGVDYLDLYLIHWPVSQIPEGEPKLAGDPEVEETPLWETFEAMNELVSAGLVKAIGVSNFNENQIIDLINDTEIIPAVNQVEIHPYLTQKSLIQFCHDKGIRVTAYSSLGNGSKPSKPGLPPLLENETITSIAKEYNKTPAQICLRWAIQQNLIVIPKSVKLHRVEENFNVFDFELSQESMERIDSLNENYRFVVPSFYKFE